MGALGSRSKAAGIAAITAVNFSWGLDFIFIEYATRYISPQFFTFIRVAVCAVVMVCFSAVLSAREKAELKNPGRQEPALEKAELEDTSPENAPPAHHRPKLDRRDIPRFLITGAVGCSLYFTAECIGTSLTSAAFSSLIMAFVPIIGMFFDRVFFANRLTPLKIGCALVSVVGVYFVVCGSPFGINVKGTLTMFAAACLWSGYIALLKPLEEKYTESQILTGIFTSGLLFLIPIMAVMGIGKCSISPLFFVVIALSAVVFIILGNFGYIYAVGRLSVSMVAMFENILPLTSVVFSVILLGSSLAPLQLVGGAIVIITATILATKE